MGGVESNSGGVHPRSRSSASLDPSMYQVLYELERRLDEKFTQSRQQNKEDIDSAIKPVYTQLDVIKDQLSSGRAEFDRVNERLGEHSDNIDNAMELVRKLEASKSSQSGQTTTQEKALKAKPKESGLQKHLVTIAVGVATAMLSAPAVIWVMVQLKLVAFADQTPVPGIQSQAPVTPGAASSKIP